MREGGHYHAPWLPDGYSQIFRSYVFGPLGLRDYGSATLQNLIPSFPWIATPRPPPWRNPRKGRDQILPSGNLGHHAPPPWAGPPMPTYVGGEKGICSPGHSVKLGPEEQEERCSWFWERNETTAKRSCALQEDEHYHQQPSVNTGFSSQGRAKLHVFCKALGRKSTQLRPSLMRKPGTYSRISKMLFCRDEIYSLQILLSRTQAGPGRTVKEEQEVFHPTTYKD